MTSDTPTRPDSSPAVSQSRIVSKRLGHADSSITSRVYVHIIAEPADRTAAAAAAMFAI